MRYLLALLLASAYLTPIHAQYVPTWDPDADGDNYITVNDLLALLSVFEEADSDDDGIFDSQDDCIGSYDACGICNGTGVDADTDGVCDDVDPCVGALDVCGVCNGPGPSVPVIDQIIYVTDSLFVPSDRLKKTPCSSSARRTPRSGGPQPSSILAWRPRRNVLSSTGGARCSAPRSRRCC